jgi:hypothetical protein
MNNIYAILYRTSVNAGFCSKLCLILFCHSETAVSHLNGRRPDHRQQRGELDSVGAADAKDEHPPHTPRRDTHKPLDLVRTLQRTSLILMLKRSFLSRE